MVDEIGMPYSVTTSFLPEIKSSYFYRQLKK